MWNCDLVPVPFYPLKGQPILVFVSTGHFKVFTCKWVGGDKEVHHFKMWNIIAGGCFGLHDSFSKVDPSIESFLAWQNIWAWIWLPTNTLIVIIWFVSVILTSGCCDGENGQTCHADLSRHHTGQVLAKLGPSLAQHPIILNELPIHNSYETY